MAKKISLFWYSLYRFSDPPKFFTKHYFLRLIGREKENYGDLLSKYLVEKISGKSTNWYNPQFPSQEKNLFAIGSILNLSNSQSIVWGSGIISMQDIIHAEDFRVVRGPFTRNRILSLGKKCPEVYGDPALLLSDFYKPQTIKKFSIGIVPHIIDIKIAEGLFQNNPHVKVINLYTNDIEKTTKTILECERIISSSLHGLIVPHSFGIPAIWARFSNDLSGDNIKFKDYFASVEIPSYNGKLIRANENLDSFFEGYQEPAKSRINQLKAGLKDNFPFKDF
jgi:pyruvyltransferase